MEDQTEQCQPTNLDHKIKSQGTLTAQTQRIHALPDRQISILINFVFAVSCVPRLYRTSPS
jgi:hypothetical protein